MDVQSLSIAISIIILIIICIHYTKIGSHENLHCDCARNGAALYAWGKGPSLPLCDMRFKGLSPYKHPNAACASPMFNPFWPPFGSANAYVSSASRTPYVDVPISRMVGDHVPLE